MKHYGDVSKMNGSKVEPVDVITFGSPCQDLSVAGKRAGIQDGERSNLFFEAVRIIKEMRRATNGEYPKYAVWENVPGAFSSNKGNDFKAVLEALCSVCDDAVSIPEPYDNKRTKLVWNKAGEIVGDNYSIAWRTLDAQYWGVPQRRKRIYLVADFTGGCAREVLFKQESLRGYFAQSRTAGQDSTRNVAGCVDGGCGVECIETVTLASSAKNAEIAYNISPCLMARAGTGGNQLPLTVYSFDSLSSNSMKSANHKSGCRAVEIAKCIDTTYPDPSKNQGGIAVVNPVFSLQGNGIDRADTAGCNGAGWRESESYTLNTVDRHAVCFENHQHGGYKEGCGTLRASGGDYGGGSENIVCYDARGNGDGGLVSTLTGDHQSCITDYTAVAVYEPKSALEENWDEAQVKNALRAGASKSSHAVVQEVKPPRRYIIRRLTPTECARLQGFPDWWSNLAPYNPDDADFWEDARKTHAEINGKVYKPVKDLKKWYNKLHTDSAEYKAYGNGLALPCAEFVIRGIAEVLRNEKGQFASKGGVIEHKGYTCIYKPEHPRAKANGYVREHILVAEEMLGRPLDGEEVVHHINGDKADNRPENLEIFPTHAEHVRHHNRTDGKKYSYNGGEFTVAELSEFSVVDYSVLTQRINKLGWDIKRAVETPKRGQPTLGSLFDGIGGFPLAGVLNGIKPVWASEVELYPIAVTKSRFGGIEK